MNFILAGYAIPGASTPMRPHNLQTTLKNSMGQLGSSNSLPRSRTTPGSGQKRHSDESHHSDDLSCGRQTPPTSDTSLTDKPVFSLEK